MLTLIPSHEKIKVAVFNLNKESSPGPDGFGGFFREYWSIINIDVCKVVIDFFTHNGLPPNMNSNKWLCSQKPVMLILYVNIVNIDQ